MVLKWKADAERKRNSVLACIPPKWRLESIPTVEEQRDVTGEYLHQFLEPLEIEITESDSTTILGKIASGLWTAVEVTTSFCHRAALAHQIVSSIIIIQDHPFYLSFLILLREWVP